MSRSSCLCFGFFDIVRVRRLALFFFFFFFAVVVLFSAFFRVVFFFFCFLCSRFLRTSLRQCTTRLSSHVFSSFPFFFLRLATPHNAVCVFFLLPCQPQHIHKYTLTRERKREKERERCEYLQVVFAFAFFFFFIIVFFFVLFCFYCQCQSETLKCATVSLQQRIKNVCCFFLFLENK